MRYKWWFPLEATDDVLGHVYVTNNQEFSEAVDAHSIVGAVADLMGTGPIYGHITDFKIDSTEKIVSIGFRFYRTNGSGTDVVTLYRNANDEWSTVDNQATNEVTFTSEWMNFLNLSNPDLNILGNGYELTEEEQEYVDLVLDGKSVGSIVSLAFFSSIPTEAQFSLIFQVNAANPTAIQIINSNSSQCIYNSETHKLKITSM